MVYRRPAKPPRRPSSGTIAALTPDARAGLWASMRAADLVEVLADQEDDDARRLVVQAWLREAYLAGASREADLESAVSTLREQVRRLRGHGASDTE